METTNTIFIAARREAVFELAARVEDWPRLLPHYRWVKLLEQDGNRKVVEMAARRDWIPVKWTSIQHLYPEEGRIAFQHVAGATRGMEVEWRIEPTDGGVDVSIWHRFRPAWPLVPDSLVHLVIGRFFVGGIAGRTLHHIKHLAET